MAFALLNKEHTEKDVEDLKMEKKLAKIIKIQTLSRIKCSNINLKNAKFHFYKLEHLFQKKRTLLIDEI